MRRKSPLAINKLYRKICVMQQGKQKNKREEFVLEWPRQSSELVQMQWKDLKHAGHAGRETDLPEPKLHKE